MRVAFRYLASQQKVANVVGTLLGGSYVNRAERRSRLFALRRPATVGRTPKGTARGVLR